MQMRWKADCIPIEPHLLHFCLEVNYGGDSILMTMAGGRTSARPSLRLEPVTRDVIQSE